MYEPNGTVFYEEVDGIVEETVVSQNQNTTKYNVVLNSNYIQTIEPASTGTINFHNLD